MKRVFVALSTLVLGFAMFGLSVNAEAAEAADGKFIVNPTLIKNEAGEVVEIPMYIMDSIQTTFPNYYDADAQPDPNWGGKARVYPWSEIKMHVNQLDAEGNATGQIYAPYFAGAMTALNADGTPTNGPKNKAGYRFFGHDMDGNENSSLIGNSSPSLSYIRYNETGAEYAVDAMKEPNDNMKVSYLAFDENGKAFRGLVSGSMFGEPADGMYTEETEFCFNADGAAVLRNADDSNCRKEMIGQVNEDGEPVLDADGNQVMIEGEKADLQDMRYVWQYFEEAPENLNENGYLGEGYLVDNWDYYFADKKVAIAFLPYEGKYTTTDDEAAAHNASVAALKEAGVADEDLPAVIEQGDDGVYKHVTKATFQYYTLPAEGYVYMFAYLDRSASGIHNNYKMMWQQARDFGRSEDYSATIHTYNFSPADLSVNSLIQDGQTLMPLANRSDDVIEVIKGTAFKPLLNINYSGVANKWTAPNQLWNKETGNLSFASDASTLEYTISVNGSQVVKPGWNYTADQKDQIMIDFLTDFQLYLNGTGVTVDGVKYIYPEVVAAAQVSASDFIHGAGNTEGFAGAWASQSWAFHNTNATKGFLGSESSKGILAKWAPLVNFLEALLAGRGYEAGEEGYMKEDLFGSAYTALARVKGYAQNASYYNPEVIAVAPTTVKAADFVIDTEDAYIGQNFDVTYTIVNPDADPAMVKEGQHTIRYTVTDVLTPVIEVKPADLYVPEGLKPNQVVQYVQSIVKAYDRNAVGDNMMGNEIEYVTIEHPTLTNSSAPAGKHLVTASVTVKGDVHQKTVVESFEVIISDTKAPTVITRDVIVPFDGDFHVLDGIIAANDDVDGNLMGSNYQWWKETSDMINTRKPGEYTVSIEAYDRTGNKSSYNFAVLVLEEVVADNSEILDGLDDLLDANDDLADDLGAQLDGLKEEVKTEIDSLTAQLSEGCGGSGAAFYALSFSALAAGAFLLKRKH